MRQQPRNATSDRDRYIGRGMGIGMILCMPLGIVLFIATGNPGLLGVGPAVGVALGVAIGEGLYQRSLRQDA
jgi:hypothetical protein